MDFSTIEGLIMAYAPLLVTVVSIVVSFVKMVREIKYIKKTGEEEKEVLYGQLRTVLNENITLKRKMNEILEKIDHIKRG